MKTLKNKQTWLERLSELGQVVGRQHPAKAIAPTFLEQL